MLTRPDGGSEVGGCRGGHDGDGVGRSSVVG